MIALGNYDPDVETGALDEYKKRVRELTVVSGGQLSDQLRTEAGWAAFTPATGNQLTVADLQRFLQDAGFFPYGKIDGICGYRTTSAIRLFQEYVRTVERKTEIGYPDGQFGNKSLDHVKRWQANNQKADWSVFSATSPSAEYGRWMALLRKVKEHYRASRSETVKKVDAAKDCATVKLDSWDFDPDKIHLVGIRHRKATQPGDARQALDDVFVLLIRGVAFKFYGSTEPGMKTEDVDTYPFLVPGQHRYRFGWHKLTDKQWKEKVYHALKPVDPGVLVQRSQHLIPTDADLSGALSGPNNSINIHWGGEGLTDDAGWSAGCQVIAGKSYLNHNDEPVDCSPFAATTYGQPGKTKGAYSVLEDLVAAFSGAVRDDNEVRYMLLVEPDLTLHPEIGAGKAGEILARLKSGR
jgi:peptidoglycan hydrolase-like protein with peptidoglycan-binding domain